MRLILLFIGLSCFGLKAQQFSPEQEAQLDSLKQVINSANHDTTIINAWITWDNIIYVADPELDFELNQKIDSLCTINLKKQLNIKEKGSFLKSQGAALNNIGSIYWNQGDYAKAIFYNTQSLKLRVELGDKQGIANSLNNIANIYADQDEYFKAIDYYTQSLKIREELGDKKGIAMSIGNIGTVYRDKGDFAKAIDYFTQSLIINEEIGYKEGIASSLNNIGVVCYDRGDYAKAIDCYTQSLQIREELGDYQDIAVSLSNIGLIYQAQGDYAKAIDHFAKSLKRCEEIGYKDGIANSLLHIGIIYYFQGDNAKAIYYYTLCLKIREELGDKSGIADSLAAIGIVHWNLRDYTKAADYYSQSMKIYEEIGNKQRIALNLHNIGLIYNDQNNYAKAIDYFTQSLKIREETEDKQGIAASLSSIGIVYKNQGDSASIVGNTSLSADNYAKALDHCLHSLSIAQKIGAAFEIKAACRALLPLYIALDSLKEANDMAVLMRDLRLKDLRINFSTLSEQQKELYFATMQGDFDLLYDFAFHYPDFTSQAENAFDNTLITKGLLLKSSTAMRNAILTSGDSRLSEHYNDWLALKRRIANTYATGGDVSEMENQANELEKELVKGSQEFSDFNKVQNLSWKDVQLGLKEGESAIEFIRFTHQDDYRKSDAVQLYAALIINYKSEYPKMVRLFEEAQLEKILGSFPGNNVLYIEQAYGSKENTKSQLYDLIWKPMEEELKGTKKVYVSPVGLLHKISFSALAKEQDVYLCDLYDIEMKSSTGKIVLADDVTYNENSTTTLFGGIDYNSDSTNTEIWTYLDGSLTETQAIEKILKKRKRSYNHYTLADATEAQFKSIAAKSNILHIATHGFFFHDPNLVNESLVESEESKEDLVFRGGSTGLGMQAFVMSRNPLMRSGLAFAAANDVWNRSSIEGEDGVLTASEVATIDMRNTELVVLSACETGLGDIKGSEGVYGLQRAFKMAGVKYIIMSLWQVPDKETAEFMTSFYKNLTKSNDIEESFNLTQKEMREKYDPYYWAAFVLIE